MGCTVRLFTKDERAANRCKQLRFNGLPIYHCGGGEAKGSRTAPDTATWEAEINFLVELNFNGQN